MEPSKFDKLLKAKLAKENSLHRNEIEKSKPYIWAQIQKQDTPILFPWYYSAAAILILLLCSSFFIINQQNNYENKLAQINKRINNLNQNNSNNTILDVKNNELDQICSEVEELEKSVEKLRNNPPKKNQIFKSQTKQLVYVRDTVFISRIEYITQYKIDTIFEQIKFNPELELVNSKTTPESTTDLIFPDYNGSETKQQKETASLKIKFGL